MRRLLITNLSHMRRSDCNLPLNIYIHIYIQKDRNTSKNGTRVQKTSPIKVSKDLAQEEHVGNFTSKIQLVVLQSKYLQGDIKCL